MRDITQYIVVGEWWPAYVLRLVKGRDKKNQLKSELRPPATSDWIDEWKGWLIRRWGEAHHCICDDETPPFPSWCSSHYIISAGRAPTIARCRVRESQSAELEINSSLSSPRPSLSISMVARPSASFWLIALLVLSLLSVTAWLYAQSGFVSSPTSPLHPADSKPHHFLHLSHHHMSSSNVMQMCHMTSFFLF